MRKNYATTRLAASLSDERLARYSGKPTIHSNRQAKNQPQGPRLAMPVTNPFFAPIFFASNNTQIDVAIIRIQKYVSMVILLLQINYGYRHL